MRSIQINFTNDGKVTVFAFLDGGNHVNVNCEVNKLQDMLPGAVYEALRDRITALSELMRVPEPLRIVR